MVELSSQNLSTASVSLPCWSSLAWTSALVGGIAFRDDDLAASMILFFILLTFLIVGLLRIYQGRTLSDILIIFVPTVVFVTGLTIWSSLRAHLSNVTHRASSSSLFYAQSTLAELVAANGLISSSPMLLCETAFQVFGLLAKRIVPTGKKWVKYTAYMARLANLIALVMVVVGACDLSSYLTAWLDQTKLAAVLSSSGIEECNMTVLGRDLTLLPLMADGLDLVVLFVLTVLTICLRLRHKLAPGVVVHVIAILLCLAFHFAWKCVGDWDALQVYLDGDWNRATQAYSFNGDDVEGIARPTRKGAEDPTLFYLLGIVPLVLAMILIYTLNLTSYTNPPPTTTIAQTHLTTRFHLFLDPASPRIELLPTSKSGGAAKTADGGKKDATPAKGGAKGKQGQAQGEMYVVKRGWLGGWSLQPAKRGHDWPTKVKAKVNKAIQSWILGWSQAKTAPVAV